MPHRAKRPPVPRRLVPPRAAVLPLLVVAAALGGLALAQAAGRNRVRHRPPDSAPRHTTRRRRFGAYAVTGRTVTIARPRQEVYDFWRDFGNLAGFMENVQAVTEHGDLTHWTIAGPMGRSVQVVTRIVQDRPGAFISWRSTPDSAIDTEGKVSFRDAPGGRGTEVEALVAWVPPAGSAGRLIAALFRADPALQARRDLKRLKMLLETGEIATSRNRPQPDDGGTECAH